MGGLASWDGWDYLLLYGNRGTGYPILTYHNATFGYLNFHLDVGIRAF